jgi:SpoVK/Ycf46/Vps4 family AAA+-type ATPase
MYGPPGCGKSCTIALLVEDVIKMGGIVLKFQQYDNFMEVLNSIRKIQPEIPIIALMEDLDEIIDDNSISEILNILDGLEQSLNKIVFLATTNKPEKIDDNIKNRPSRFDRRIKFDLPNEEMREAYLKHLFMDSKIPNKLWISKTKGFSLAHLKELFVSVILLGNNFNSSILELKKMADKIIE